MPPHNSHQDARFWIETLGLIPHPEGGWFKETYRSSEAIPLAGLPPRFPGPRSLCTSIYFLLEPGQFSALHRIKSDEIWHFHEGGPLTVQVLSPSGESHALRLGRNAERGERFQAVVPAGSWFGAETGGDFSLVGCTVAPGFDFTDFDMADRTDLCKSFPHQQALIRRLTRT